MVLPWRFHGAFIGVFKVRSNGISRRFHGAACRGACHELSWCFHGLSWVHGALVGFSSGFRGTFILIFVLLLSLLSWTFVVLLRCFDVHFMNFHGALTVSHMWCLYGELCASWWFHRAFYGRASALPCGFHDAFTALS